MKRYKLPANAGQDYRVLTIWGPIAQGRVRASKLMGLSEARKLLAQVLRCFLKDRREQPARMALRCLEAYEVVDSKMQLCRGERWWVQDGGRVFPVFVITKVEGLAAGPYTKLKDVIGASDGTIVNSVVRKYIEGMSVLEKKANGKGK